MAKFGLVFSDYDFLFIWGTTKGQFINLPVHTISQIRGSSIPYQSPARPIYSILITSKTNPFHTILMYHPRLFSSLNHYGAILSIFRLTLGSSLQYQLLLLQYQSIPLLVKIRLKMAKKFFCKIWKKVYFIY